MYLQSLEIIGFKSFAAKTVLNFHRGVTAIVGPNGCGKSNVLDAMRWVLGEQSAKALRGGEMADVIFSGTDSRPALGMAEVSMTFSECEKELGVDWNEVRITRRVYRDGKSEYFLNKTSCRLRDIHQLFMDTGVGRSAYSIMEQGKIDQILSNRPEDRRAIFEEAAGITKFKAQKKEALRKLEYTESNLVRVQDIIKEVKRQIGSLQRQAAKARRYQSILNDLRVFDTHLSHKNYSQLSSELQSLRAQLTQGEEAREIHEVEIAQQEVELDTFRQRLQEIEAEAGTIRDGMQTLRNRVFSAENRIATNHERSAEAATLIERHRLDIFQAEEKIRTQQEQIEQTDTLLQQMIENLRTNQQTLDEHTARLNEVRSERIAAEREVSSQSAELSHAEARLNSLRGEISAATGRRESGETRLHLLQNEIEAASRAAGEVSANLESLKHRSDAAHLALEHSQAETSAAMADHETAQRQRQDTEAILNAAGKDAAGIESRLEVLRQLQEQGEGLDEGTQALLKGLDNPDLYHAAIKGTLVQHIQVEERLIPAIEAALGSALQAVIFKDITVAEAALSKLAGQKLGRACVIPAEWISSDSVGQASRLSPDPSDGDRDGRPTSLPFGVFGRASDCVKGDGEGAILARQLLRDVLIVENLEAAFRMRSEHPRFAFASLDGGFISLNGIIHGGATGENAGQSTLQRKIRITELDASLAEATSKIESLAVARASAVSAMDQATDRLKHAREAMNAAQVESASVDNERRHAERQLADAEAKRASFQREAASIEEGLRGSLAQLSELESRIAETTCSLDSLRSARSECEARIQVVRERESSASDALNEIRVRVATERQQQEGLHRQRGPMSARIVELNELLDARRVDISNYESRLESLAAENASLEISIGEWRAELESEESRLSAVLAQRSEVNESASALESALRAARQQLASLQDQRSRIEVKAAQSEMRMENIRSHVSQRYQTDLEAFEPDTYGLLVAFRDRAKRKPESAEGETLSAEAPAAEEELPAEPIAMPSEGEGIPWDHIEELVAELTERLDSMGPVNVDAIQEFEELEERYIFLEKQNADLVSSKAELLEVISKINHTTKTLFAETFEKIRENFQVMFTELFGGGRANLMLMDDSDPLESGIEIIAKPPGKQLQSISLLSGGERTMTAVSLLFAIYMVKPSPFCVLDEMDAPLDESNITRFIKILDRFVDQSQFVTITHNKRTISRADMLYGVTMEEHGISKLVSVRFSNSTDDRAKSSESVAKAFGKSENLASEEPAAESGDKSETSLI
ncbi:MAG: chromosome segregation protein SMC [Spartobacteria bacterium AMD-G5]|nr:MAG: chromosome segregation protein SMC [Spartobacteria bacterium AMD-G5]